MTTRSTEQIPLGIDATRQLPTLDERLRGTSFVGLQVARILNPPEATGMSFWSINPYVGCEFGCSYCYARDTHRWTAERHGIVPGRSPREDFERRIFVKRNAADVLRRTLDAGRVGRTSILIGTATDPYQPAERTFRVTRSVLEALTGYRGLRISITTKSPLVARDVDVLTRLAARNRVSVNFSIVSIDPGLIRRLEPRTPLPHARLRGLRILADAGINAGLMIAPIVPGLSDGWGALGGLMAAGKEAGARYADGFALRLAPVARSGFLPLLDREFPELAERYRRGYGARHSADQRYLHALANRIRTLQKIHGFPLTSRFSPRTEAEQLVAGKPPAAPRIARARPSARSANPPASTARPSLPILTLV